jgi:hypothetical protein
VSRAKDGKSINRSWVFRYQLKGGKQRDMSLGSLHDNTLLQARKKARSYRKMLETGIGPDRPA